MQDDPIVEETHRVRREISAEFAGDVHAFFEYLRQREAKRPGEVVTLEPVTPEPSAISTPSSAANNKGG
jgi:hypothetical protein